MKKDKPGHFTKKGDSEDYNYLSHQVVFIVVALAIVLFSVWISQYFR